jgi:hypothetical protein
MTDLFLAPPPASTVDLEPALDRYRGWVQNLGALADDATRTAAVLGPWDAWADTVAWWHWRTTADHAMLLEECAIVLGEDCRLLTDPLAPAPTPGPEPAPGPWVLPPAWERLAGRLARWHAQFDQWDRFLKDQPLVGAAVLAAGWRVWSPVLDGHWHQLAHPSPVQSVGGQAR